jgi:hypothetical protein
MPRDREPALSRAEYFGRGTFIEHSPANAFCKLAFVALSSDT